MVDRSGAHSSDLESQETAEELAERQSRHLLIGLLMLSVCGITLMTRCITSVMKPMIRYGRNRYEQIQANRKSTYHGEE